MYVVFLLAYFYPRALFDNCAKSVIPYYTLPAIIKLGVRWAHSMQFLEAVHVLHLITISKEKGKLRKEEFRMGN